MPATERAPEQHWRLNLKLGRYQIVAQKDAKSRQPCAPASRWRQGQALRVLRNLDPAGRGRMIENAGSEGMPLSCPTKGMATQKRLSSCSQNVPGS